MKDDHDGAEPSAGSTSVCNLLMLSHLVGDAWLADRLEAALRAAAPRLPGFARGLPMMMAGLSVYHAGIRQIALVGPRGRDDTTRLLDALHSVYQPFAVSVRVEPGEAQQALARVLPWVAPLTMRDGRATVYVCRGFVCDEPVTSPDAL